MAEETTSNKIKKNGMAIAALAGAGVLGIYGKNFYDIMKRPQYQENFDKFAKNHPEEAAKIPSPWHD